MAKQFVSNSENINKSTSGSQISTSSKPYTKEIADAFAKHLDQTISNYMSLSKNQLAKKFEEFIKEEYGNDVLGALRAGKVTGQPIDVELNSLLKKGFTIKDIIQPEQVQILGKQFEHSRSEIDVIKDGLHNLYIQYTQLPIVSQKTLDFKEFLRLIGYKTQVNTDGNVIGIVPQAVTKSYSTVTIKKIRGEFLHSSGITDTDRLSQYRDMLDFSHFDSTEKLACVSIVQKLDQRIEQLSQGDTKKGTQLRNHLQAVFGKITHPLPVGASWMTMSGLSLAMNDWFVRSGSLLTDRDVKHLQDMKVDMKSAIEVGAKEGLRDKDTDIKLRDKRFSELNRQFQTIANKFATIDIINNVADTMDDLNETIDDYTKSFDIPGNLHHFFDQFGLPGKKSSVSQRYQQLLQQEEQLREKLSDPTLSTDKRVEYEEVLHDIKEKIIGLQQSEQSTTRNTYFHNIGQQVSQVQKNLTQSHSGEQVEYVLLKLQKNKRDISSLPLSEQNILMRASIAMQLSAVKDKNSLKHFGVSFQEYAQFVTELYDFESKHATITTKDGVAINLDFISKKFVGKPLEFHTVDIENITDLQNIRVEFELNLNDNPLAENFIRTMTGGPQSPVVMDFRAGQHSSLFPNTITDSSLVKMVDNNGIVYEGYLSPIDEREDDEDLGDMDGNEKSKVQKNAQTFILYDKPADQLHTDRKHYWQKNVQGEIIKTSEGKKKPVFINPYNLKDWKSIDILEKKVTLSDKQLKALTLGHGLTKNINSSDFESAKNSVHVSKILQSQDQYLLDDLIQDTRDTIENTKKPEQNVENKEQTVSQEFAKEWKEIAGEKPCEVGARIAVKLPETIEGTKTIDTFPKSEQLLAMKVKSIKKDEKGEIIGVTFGFENLSRIGRCGINDVTLEGKKLSKVKEIFPKTTYLDSPTDVQDYTSTFTRLEKTFGKQDKYQRDNLRDLSFNGSDFIKNKDKITKFLAPEKIKGEDKKEYCVEYTVEKKGSNAYRVTSSPYRTSVADKDGKQKEQTIQFDTTTDLSGMLLILAGKNLKPLTKNEHDEHFALHPSETILPEKRYGAGSRWSLNTIASVLKGGWKDIADKWTKKLEETRNEELQYLLFQENNIYRKLQSTFGGMLEVFDMDIFDDLADEAEEKAMGYGFKKVESRYSQLKKFHHSYNYGGSLSNDTKIGGANDMVQSDVDNALEYFESGREIPYKIRTQVAGGLRYMIEKYKGGYARRLDSYPRGTYVKILFGQTAYRSFMNKYKEEEKKLKALPNGNQAKRVQAQLVLFEYNYISHNISGGPRQDMDFTQHVGSKGGPTDEGAWYYQRLYGREYGNKLRESIQGIQDIDASEQNDEVKGLISGASFAHLKSEYYSQISAFRMKDALAQLLAMQQKAVTKEEVDEVTVAIMAGILNGSFIHHLGSKTRDSLRVVCRQNGFPLTPWMEHFDAQDKIASLLSMITAGEFDEKFNYDKDNFNPFNYQKISKKDGSSTTLVKNFTNQFRDWLSPGTDMREKIMSFIHMDNLEEEGDNNLMRIRTSGEDELPVIYGKQITQTQKEYVDEFMNEFYYNRDRGAKMDNYNWQSGFPHPRTMIEQANQTIFNEHDRSNPGSFKLGNGDHAETYYTVIGDKAPKSKTLKITSQNQYKLRFFVEDFFRIFAGWGHLAYTKDQIEKFYIYVRKAQEQKDPKDQARLVRFYLTKQLYATGPLPKLVEDAAKQYIDFFEKNLHMFDAKLGKMHFTPQSLKASGQNFEYVFKKDISDYVYYTDTDWKKVGNGNKRENEYRKMQKDGIDILNGGMDEANLKAKGTTRGGYSEGTIESTIDDKIAELRGESVIGDYHPGSLDVKKSTISTIDSSEIDFSDIGKRDYRQKSQEVKNNVYETMTKDNKRKNSSISGTTTQEDDLREFLEREGYQPNT